MTPIVFTDLDGTLLDHDSYSYAAAQPALDALRRAGIPLILASSKTAAEIAPLHAALGLGDWPIIAENGAARLIPGAAVSDRSIYHRLRSTLDALPADLRAPYRGFGDMDDAEVARITGLPLPGAALARARQYSEPGLWSGSAAGLDAFLAALGAQGITARRGGRFLTLSFGGTKAGQMAAIMRDLGRDTAIALGDAPNDIEMIETARYGIVIRNDHGSGIAPLAGEATGRILRSTSPGPKGWNTELLALLGRLGVTEGQT
ncbi:HAD-IIB family hydrolase [Citreicella sp. C3M06]|uniref:HAD-IIB family hydrolase n=1 Tax=Citreicella sp. C3M06 TaxID=2841564 RepID=UPI001C0907D7|nr:HAD-IIB family hydrolase [Citreicella sp. C3M06]